ncbi:hypothetical protein CPB86DRAFT_794134 [Serendipita vermifera]|nr:hypothetical protein CPB86DRAFT_794134 [Serendipita vermifera]
MSLSRMATSQPPENAPLNAEASQGTILVSSPVDPEFTSPVDPRELNDKLNAHKRAKELNDNPASPSTENASHPGQQPPSTDDNSHSQQRPRFTGYLHRGKRRELNELTGEWEVKDENEAPSTGYRDRKTFPDDKSKVFVVTYFPNGEQDTVWRNPTSDHNTIKEYLEVKENSPNSWRWVYCEGLHGETLQLIAKETGGRGSAEYIKRDSHAPERLYLHFIDQSTKLYVLFARTGPCFNPRKQLISKILGYADRGDSRVSCTLLTHPYRKSVPESNIRIESEQENVILLLVIKLNTAALKNTNVNLKVFIDAMHDDKSINIPLVSKNAQYMLKDQMGLVDLLAEEIPDFIRQAEAISNLAFNTLTASNNRFLKVIAGVTTLLLPLTLVISLLSMDSLNSRVNNSQDKILDEEESVNGNHILTSAFQDLENSNRVDRLNRGRDKVYDAEPDQFSPNPLGSPLRGNTMNSPAHVKARTNSGWLGTSIQEEPQQSRGGQL